MKTLLTLVLIQFAITVNAQTPTAALESPELNVLYRGYANRIIPAVSDKENRTVILSGNGVELKKQEGQDYYIAKPGRDRIVTISISLIDEKDTILVKEVEYRVHNLPDPYLYLGTSREGQNADVNATKLFAKYPPEIPLNAKYRVMKWTITINEETISGKGDNMSSASEVLKAAPNGTEVIAEVTVQGPDGIFRKKTGSWIIQKSK